MRFSSIHSHEIFLSFSITLLVPLPLTCSSPTPFSSLLSDVSALSSSHRLLLPPSSPSVLPSPWMYAGRVPSARGQTWSPQCYARGISTLHTTAKYISSRMRNTRPNNHKKNGKKRKNRRAERAEETRPTIHLQENVFPSQAVFFPPLSPRYFSCRFTRHFSRGWRE